MVLEVWSAGPIGAPGCTLVESALVEDGGPAAGQGTLPVTPGLVPAESLVSPHLQTGAYSGLLWEISELLSARYHLCSCSRPCAHSPVGYCILWTTLGNFGVVVSKVPLAEWQ